VRNPEKAGSPASPGRNATDLDRRPIQARSARLIQALARLLAQCGLSPNQVSISSVGFAIIGSCLLAWEATGTPNFLMLIGTAVCIQLRLLANLLDGLMAVEGGHQTKTGEMFNEFPDRIADVSLLGAAGYAARQGHLGIAAGWMAAVLAVGTAYIRAFGARRGYPQDFCGPLAKQQRMFLLTLGCSLGAGEELLGMPSRSIFVSLIVIAVGTLITCFRRSARLARRLEGK